jgi:hypothetical protein
MTACESNATAFWLEHILHGAAGDERQRGRRRHGAVRRCSGFPNEHAGIAKAAGIGPRRLRPLSLQRFAPGSTSRTTGPRGLQRQVQRGLRGSPETFAKDVVPGVGVGRVTD